MENVRDHAAGDRVCLGGGLESDTNFIESLFSTPLCGPQPLQCSPGNPLFSSFLNCLLKSMKRRRKQTRGDIAPKVLHKSLSLSLCISTSDKVATKLTMRALAANIDII